VRVPDSCGIFVLYTILVSQTEICAVGSVSERGDRRRLGTILGLGSTSLSQGSREKMLCLLVIYVP
jgi:hypothetical protein